MMASLARLITRSTLQATLLTLITLLSLFSTTEAKGKVKETPADRITNAYLFYCQQEEIANDDYCQCVANVYRDNLPTISLDKREEKFLIVALSGKLSYANIEESDFPFIENLMEKIDDPRFEEGFAHCAAYNEELFIEEVEEINENDSPMSADQIRAIEEIEAIEMEEMDDEEIYQ